MDWISLSISLLITIFGLLSTLPQLYCYLKYKKTRGISFFSIFTEYSLYSIRSTYSMHLLYPQYMSCYLKWNNDCMYYIILTVNNIVFSLLFLTEIILFFYYYERERRNILRIEHLPVKRKCSYLFLYIPMVVMSIFISTALLVLHFAGFKSTAIFKIQDITIRLLILLQGLPQLCHSLYYRFIGNLSLVSFLFLSLTSLLKVVFFAVYDNENQIWIYYLVSFVIQFTTFVFLSCIHLNYIRGNDPEVDFYLLSVYNDK